MADFGDRIQALMNEFYNEWQKEENKGKSKWDVLNGFSAAYQIAVVFGNFNYQVENGGLEQWIYNGYFHDDAEKLVEYLEIGAESDERCRTILDRIYKLGQLAEDTGCDRYGSYYDEDGDSLFIGEMINCGTFDSWYYEKCDGDDWWQVACGIIDKVEGRESELVRKDERESGITAAARFPLRVYIENAEQPDYGGFTMPLPTTMEAMRPFLEKIELTSAEYMRIFDVTADDKGLGDTVTAALENSTLPDMLNEVNYLAAKIVALAPDDFEVFSAVVGAKRHCTSVAELINLTDNIGIFELQPAFDAAMLGEHLVHMDADKYSEAFEKLYASDDEVLRGLIDYIEYLEKHPDYTAYGEEYAKDNQGVFTQKGYLEEHGEFKEVYRGPQDIPVEYLAIIPPEPKPLLKAQNTDLTNLLLKMHALGGDYMHDAHYNLNVLDGRRSAEYLLLMDGRNCVITEAAHAYRHGTTAFDYWTRAAERTDINAYAIHVTDMHDPSGHVIGDIAKIDFAEQQRDILSHCIHFTRVDATPKFGPDRSYTPEEWNGLEAIDRDMLGSWTRHYEDKDYQAVLQHLEEIRAEHADTGEVVAPDTILSELSGGYMASAENPQPDMLRITLNAAKDMLERGGAPVYRLFPKGPEQLSPLDAMQSRGGLWYQSYREFAVKMDDLGALDKWAGKAADAMLISRQPERGAQDKTKSKNPEL